jgi:hypothetical protein
MIKPPLDSLNGTKWGENAMWSMSEATKKFSSGHVEDFISSNL